MKYLKLCCVAPHPPIMVSEIGGRDVRKVESSISALEELGAEIESVAPETLVVMSPHSPIYPDAFSVKAAPHLSGTFRDFGAPQVGYQSEPDMELVDELADRARDKGLRVEKTGAGAFGGGADLDHGILVPLYFMGRKRYPLVCLSLSLLDYRDHYKLGMALRDAVEGTGRKTVFIASGDLSHRLKPGAPAGYSPRGEELDRELVDIINRAEYARLFTLDPMMVDEAGECGLRSIIALAGSVDGYTVESKVMSYEGPFGVGYMVARVAPGEPQAKRSIVSL